MKRAILMILFLGVAIGVAYWVQGLHHGDVRAAWADAAARIGVGASAATGEAASGKAQGTARGRAGRGEGQRIAVLTAVARTQDLPITLNGIGWIEPVATVTLRARVDGQIVEQNAHDGRMVERGDVLFRLDDREIQAQIARDQAALTRDQANLAKAEADLKRTEQLLSKNIASQVQADQFTADAKVAAANVAADKATLEADRIKLDYTAIKAPIAGRLGTVRFTEGNLVRGNDNSGDGLVTITQMKPLRVSFSLPERDLDLVRSALNRDTPAPVRVYPSGSDELLAVGKLSFLDSSVDQTSGTVTVKATFPNEDGRLWPGQYVRVELDAGMRNNATTVPLVAVQPGQDAPFAYVVNQDKVVERRKVDIATRQGDLAAIGAGIKPGEHVVVEGQLRLKDGSHVTETVAGRETGRRTAEAVGQELR